MRWKDALTDFLHYVKLERGLSENSVENYRFDVLKLTRFLTEHKNSVSPIDIKSTTIQSFVYESSKKLKAPSQARMLSGLRLFFDFLILFIFETINFKISKLTFSDNFMNFGLIPIFWAFQ